MSDGLDCGIVWINDDHKNDPCSSFGGVKQSGMGRENGLDALREYTQTKSTIVSFTDEAFDWFVTDDSGKVRYG